MEQKIHHAVETKEREVVMNRVIDAPPKIVYKALTTPEDIEQWWGPHGFTNKVDSDLRTGGNYRFVMQDEKGVNYPMTGNYKELIENEKIVMSTDLDEHPLEWRDKLYKELPQRDRATALISTLTFNLHAEGKGKTRLTVSEHFESNAIRDAYKKLGMTEGWTESFERLDKVVEKEKVH